MNNAQLINQDSGNVEIYTPPEIIEAARECMGGIDLDPASCAKANETVKAARYFTKEDDGLFQLWASKRVWLNHPFSRTGNKLWVEKAVLEHQEGRATAICMICFASTSEAWFRPLLAFPQCFLTPRTNYRLPDGSVYRGVTKGSVVTYMGPDVQAFKRAFSKLGVVKVAL